MDLIMGKYFPAWRKALLACSVHSKDFMYLIPVGIKKIVASVKSKTRPHMGLNPKDLVQFIYSRRKETTEVTSLEFMCKDLGTAAEKGSPE